jgi:hypothetical protein
MSNRKFIDNDGAYHWLLQGEPEENWTEVFDDPNQLPDPNYQVPYDSLRVNNYPTIGNQLDMLWHELNTSGSISADGGWFQSIQEVKQQYPKP